MRRRRRRRGRTGTRARRRTAARRPWRCGSLRTVSPADAPVDEQDGEASDEEPDGETDDRADRAGTVILPEREERGGDKEEGDGRGHVAPTRRAARSRRKVPVP